MQTKFLLTYLLVASFFVVADDYTVDLSLASFDGFQPRYVRSIDSYCMESTLAETRIDNGHASFVIYTDSNVLHYCGWRHSSETFAVIDSAGDTIMTFKFEKSIAKAGTIYGVKQPSSLSCDYDDSGYFKLGVDCKQKVSTSAQRAKWRLSKGSANKGMMITP